jgi:DNA gyrase subunit A
MLFFTDRGRVHWIKVHEIPRAGRLSKGRAIVNMLQIESGEVVTAYMSVREFSEGQFILMATQQGVVKKTPLTDFRHPRKGGIIAILLNEKDRLIQARLTDGEQNILLATRDGQAIRFRETDVRSMGRPARGVRGVSLAKKDEVIGMTVVPDDATVLVVTVNGYGKRTRADAYRLQKRGGKGVINIKTTERNGVVVAMMAVQDNDELVVVTSGGKLIRSRIREISVIGRNTQGMRIINVGGNDRVGGVACVETEEDAETTDNGNAAEAVVEETETVETTEQTDTPETVEKPVAAEKAEKESKASVPKKAEKTEETRKGTKKKK